MIRYQSSLKLFSNDIKDEPIFFELKPYIQPFEKILARAELAGLLEPGLINDPFGQQATEKITVSTHIPVNIFQHRLAYWQRVGTNGLLPTIQVLLEASQDWPIKNVLKIKHGEISTRLPVRRRLRYGPHDIHEYRGKFFPQLVKALINSAGTSDGGIVIDPMFGSGTTPCEARSMGMKAIGLDLNPLSVKIARTKTSLLTVDSEFLQVEVEQLIKKVEYSRTAPDNDLEKRWGQQDLDYLNRWFAYPALCEINQILRAIDLCKQSIVKELAEVCLSNILRSVSWQKITDLRVRKEVKDYVEGTTLCEFVDEINRQVKKVMAYLSVIEEKSSLPSVDLREGDARVIYQELKSWKGECDVLITSPPYAMALPYIDTDRLSLVVLGLLPRAEHRSRELLMIGNREILESKRLELWEIYQNRRSDLPENVSKLIDKLAKLYHNETVGFRRRNLPALLAKYYLDMTDSMRSTHEMMRPNSYAFYVTGNNSTKGNGDPIEIPTNEFLWQIGKKVGWTQEKLINMELLASRDIFRKNRGTSEKILVFRSNDRSR